MSTLLHRLRSPLSSHPLWRRLRPTLLTITSILTWIPVLSFINTHVAQLMWVTGPSMYPFLNTDYNTSTRKDVVWVNMWAPAEGLRRGTVVAFWYVVILYLSAGGAWENVEEGRDGMVKGVG